MKTETKSGVRIVPGMRIMDLAGPGEPSEGVVIATAKNGVVYRVDAGKSVAEDSAGELWVADWDCVAICAQQPTVADLGVNDEPDELAPFGGDKVGPWTARAIGIYRALQAASHSAEGMDSMPDGVEDGVLEPQMIASLKDARRICGEVVLRMLAYAEPMPPGE